MLYADECCSAAMSYNGQLCMLIAVVQQQGVMANTACQWMLFSSRYKSIMANVVCGRVVVQ